MLIGLTGTKASGKGVLSDILRERGFIYYSLSDCVRDEAVRRGISNYTTRDLQDIGDDLREKYGLGVLAKRVIEQLEKYDNYVIDGIRNPGEVQELKNYGNFFLIAVDAPLEQRFERLLKRNRASDPKKFEEFLIIDERDRKSNKEKGQQVEKCMELADIKIYNDSSVDSLIAKINAILGNLKC